MDIKEHDRRPWFVAQAQNADGSGVDLTGALSRQLIMRKEGSAIKFKADVELLTTQPPIPDFYDPSTEQEPVTDLDGWFRYKWAVGDTDDTGPHNSELEVMWAADDPQTFPTVGYYVVNIGDDLDDD